MIDFSKHLTTYKKYKFLVLIIVGLITLFLLALVVSYGVDIVTKIKTYHYTGRQYATISVSGEGKIYAKADVVIVDLSVVSEGKRVIDVQNENTEKMNQVIEFLKDFGINEKDIKTMGYNLVPQYSYEEHRSPKITGYSLTQTLEVKIRDLDKTGEILEGVVNYGANQIGSLYFKNDKDEELKEKARGMAIDDAQKKAKKLVSQLGVKLIRISGYNEGVTSPYYRADYEMMKGIGGGGGEAPQIQVGENEIIINVTITYDVD